MIFSTFRPNAMMNTPVISEPETPSINPLNQFLPSHVNRSCIVVFDLNQNIISPFVLLVSSGVSVASSTISSIDVLGEDLTNQKFGRLYRRWLKFANRTMKQSQRQVKTKD